MLKSKQVMTYFMFVLLRPCRNDREHNFEVEATLISLIGWPHKTSTMYSVQQLWNSGSPISSQYEKLMHVYRSMSEVLFVAPDRCCKMLREKCASRKSKVKWVHKLFEEAFFFFCTCIVMSNLFNLYIFSK